MTDLWRTRNLALQRLQGDLVRENELLAVGFALHDEILERLAPVMPASNFASVAAIVIIKGRNLALGHFSLALDGLAQEAGALLRPMLEALELLMYLNAEPTRYIEVFENRLPKAGEIAKSVDGHFRDLRAYLNQHASHFGFSIDSIKHIVDTTTNELRIVQPFSAAALRVNMGEIFLFEYMLLSTAFTTLETAGADVGDLDRALDKFETAGRRVFFDGVNAPETWRDTSR